jgi:hypothetical protein
VDPGHLQVLAKRVRSIVEKHRAEERLKVALQTSTDIINTIPSGLLL